MVTRAGAVFAVVIVLTLTLTLGVSAADTRVYDNAGLLAPEEVSQLETYIDELRTETGYDFVFLADTSLPYDENYDSANNAAVAHADDFYDYGGYGDPSNDRAGMIFYLDMSNRIPVITTTGRMIDIINDARLSNLFDTVYSYLGSEDYYGAAYNMFAQAKGYIDAGVVDGQHRYDAGEGGVDINEYKNGIIKPPQLRVLSGTEAIFALGAGLAVSLIYFSVVKSRYSLKGRVYRYDLGVNTKCELTAMADDFLHETVTRTRRATSNSSGSGGRGGGSGSGVHTSSSGGSHGGGGGGHRF